MRGFGVRTGAFVVKGIESIAPVAGMFFSAILDESIEDARANSIEALTLFL
jgi:hypothetical protein